jgi:HAD superfamily hydrolase (TIGR01490 family)
MALAFFDLDETLTKFDTFIPYCLLSLLYRPRRVFTLKPLLKACINFFRGRIERQDLKEAFLAAFLEGARRNDIELFNRGFFRFILPWIIREEMIEKMRLHKQAGDRVYLVSASPDVYLDTLASQWRLDGVICTKLEWKNGLLTGKILGKNCKGEEKARRIQALFDKVDLEGSFAYGNRDGDRQLLELVTFGTEVNRRW